ncbi:MAG TPA: hypothetical protein VNM90_06305, partial [Haliangium sp.]|nr:hypothetical protein [Haliangium sp.]
MITGIGIVITGIGRRDQTGRGLCPREEGRRSRAAALDREAVASSEGAAMATERLSMATIREILRLKWVLGKSHR